jgi:ABC-type antimicrobial peptide transport system permease subunit
VLIDERVAQQFFPSASPLGHEIVTGDDHLRIVGVVRQPRLYDVHRDGRGQLWARNDDIGYSSLYYALRTEGDPLDLVPAVRSAVRRLDPALPLADLRPLAELVEQAVRQQRLSAALVGGFAVGALLLAAMGLFGLVAGAVTRRRHELGVRLALGAGRRRVVRLVVADGLGLVALGVLLGVPGVWALGRFLDGVVVDISPFDPATLAAVAAGLGLVAAVACWLPARRVAAIDPASSLRAE